MSKARRRVRRRRSETGALQILEEAFHLVRSAGAGAFLRYYLGAVPWSVGLLYFVADMSRSSLAARDAAFASLLLAGLYFWMRYCQARFCAALWERLNPGRIPAASGWARFGVIAALFFLQSFHVPLLAIGLFFAIPLGWIVAMQQNFSVLAFTIDHRGRPYRSLLHRSILHSHHEWAQNHGILIVFFFVSLFTWVNLIATCVFLPGLAKSFFGVESVFTLSPAAAVMNTTFLLGTFLLVQLAMVPLMLSAYVLRGFYAESRASGADILSRLEACREKREREERLERGTLGRVALIGAILLVGSVQPVFSADDPGQGIVASTAAAGSDTVAVAELEREIAGTLEQKKYQWQLSRREGATEAEAERSWIGQRITEIAGAAKRLLESIEEWFEEMMRKLMERGGGGADRGKRPDFAFFEELSSTVSLAIVIVVVSLALWGATILYRRHRGREKPAIGDEGRAGAIDLASEDIVATQLHEDEWLRLAREQIGKGEDRLAIRALFLATLAHLGEKGLLKIVRSKSNRDYRRELALRARHLSRLREAFDENTNLFERVWYGMHQPGEGATRTYLSNHEVISSESSVRGPSAAREAGVR